MKATVVVSCFNQEQYIKECLDSILAQEVDFDFDILISDDCSTDSTATIIQNYQAQAPHKINVIARPQNIGVAANYMDAHQNASGDVIFHIDGDDVMLPGKLQKQFELFRNNEQVNLVFHRAQYFSDDGSYCSDTGSPKSAQSGLLYFNSEDLACWGSITVHSAYAYRKSSRKFTRTHMEFMEWFFAMDSLLPDGVGVYIDELLVKYRCNLAGKTYLSTKKGRQRAYKIYLNDLFYYFSKYPALRKKLYSNALITTGGMLQSRCMYNLAVLFLVKNIFCFNWSMFKEAWQMRRAVAPAQKVR